MNTHRNVRLYSTRICPYCRLAKRLLEHKQVNFEEIEVDLDPSARDEMMQRSGRHTVPQIFIDDQHVGGYTDIAALDHSGQLDHLLKAA